MELANNLETANARKLCNFCSECWEHISDDRPPLTGKEDDETIFWRDRGKCGRQQLVTPLVAVALFLFDVGMDCQIAATHFRQGHYNWGAYTAGVVFFSLVISEALSASFYISDQRDQNKTYWLKKYSLDVKGWFYGLHFVFCGRVLRCFHIFKSVRLVRRIQSHDPDNIQLYRLLISQRRQMSILGVVEAFSEEAPQIVLQLYILIEKRDFDWSFDNLMVAVNIAKSLVLFSYSLLNFIICLRLGNEKSELLELFSWASLFHFSWRLFMLIARILAFVLFASSFKHFVFVMVGIHFIFSFLLLLAQRDKYFEDGCARDSLLRCVFTCINTFCFFPLAGKNTRKWAIPYYFATFIENSIMVLLWNFHSDFGGVFKVTVLLIEWSTYLIGLVSVLLYYKIFHPSKRNQQDNTDRPDIHSASVQFETTV